MEPPTKTNWRCPIYKKCVGNGHWYICTWAKDEGVPFKFEPKCFIDKTNRPKRK